MAENSVILLGVGDVGPIHEPLDGYSSLVRATLAGADIRFAQVERVYSERGALQVHSGGDHSRLQPHMASVFSDCGFDVVSLASNHAMDWGEDALLDTHCPVPRARDAGDRSGPQPARGTPAGGHRAQRRANRVPRVLLDPANGLRGGTRQAGNRAAARAHVLRAVRLPGGRAAARRHRSLRGRSRGHGGGHRRGEERRRTWSCCRCTGASISSRG